MVKRGDERVKGIRIIELGRPGTPIKGAYPEGRPEEGLTVSCHPSIRKIFTRIPYIELTITHEFKDLTDKELLTKWSEIFEEQVDRYIKENK
jgi:hypothetical protein